MTEDRKRFFTVADERGWSWFRVRFADTLTEKLGDENKELLRWLLLHLAIQAGTGHIRTDLVSLEGEIDEWLRSESGDLPRGTGPDLPARIAGSAEELIRTNPRLFSVLPTNETAVDDIPTPRPPLLVSPDSRYTYLLRRRREEDYLLHSVGKLLEDDEPGSFPLPGDSRDTPEAVLTLAELLNRGRRLLLLAGGPGTGKTTAVISLLNLLDAGRREAGRPPLTVALTAPTGRAAARLSEETSHSGSTMHSLIRGSTIRPLDFDLIVVDEASMVDLPLMNRLIEALPSRGCLLLVGDPDQLPSVDIGALLGDLLGGAEDPDSRLHHHVVTLNRVYRSDTAVLEAAAAIRSGNPPETTSGVVIRPIPDLGELAEILAADYRRELESLSDTALATLYNAFGRYAVLSPLRKGPFGIAALNERIREALGRGHGIPTAIPVVITANDADRRVFNGDRGVLVETGDKPRIAIPEGGNFRVFPPSALPGWEPAWIQTVHKSQGSEFDRIIVLLPAGAGRLLTREILYTAVTRAKHRVELWADEEALERALKNRVVRNSRIRDWAASPRDRSGSD